MRKAQIKKAIKSFRKALQEKNLQAAKETFNRLQKVLDRAAAKGTIHKNKASRKKSQFAKLLQRYLTLQEA